MASVVTQAAILQANSLYVTDTGELHGLQIVTIDVYGNEIEIKHIVKDDKN